jgi:hypothetical protein
MPREAAANDGGECAFAPQFPPELKAGDENCAANAGFVPDARRLRNGEI